MVSGTRPLTLIQASGDTKSGVNFDFVAPAAENRGLMTFGAGNGIEQRPEAILGRKTRSKIFFLPNCTLFRREIRQRCPVSRWLACTRKETTPKATHPQFDSHSKSFPFEFSDSSPCHFIVNEL
jgi:hypothetical protein